MRRHIQARCARWLLAAVLATSASAGVGAAEPQQQWVQGSWVNVRAEPQAAARVVASVPANTPVRVEGRQGDWCQATAGAVQGWIACALLAAQPQTLGALHAALAAGASPADYEARAFWVAPSVGRWMAVGRTLNYTALSAEQQARQERTKQPVRFALPAFDAMKARLTTGVVPVIENEVPRVRIADFRGFDGIPGWRMSDEEIRALKAHEPARNLPPAKPSLWRRHADVVLLPEWSVDAVTALLGQPSQVRFSGQPEWVEGHHDSGVWGIWDVRDVHVRFARPAALHAVARSGLVGVRLVEGLTLSGLSPAETCQGGLPELPAGTPLAGYPRLKDRPLVAFFVAAPLGVKQRDVVSRKSTVLLPADGSPHQPPQPRRVTVHQLDLDGDGHADLGIFEMPVIGPVSGQATASRLYFVNIAGEWWYAGQETFQECT